MIAFYAPMKSPHHPVPSGDRTLARGILAALEAGQGGAQLVSQLRIYDGAGEAARQEALIHQANAEITRLTRHPQAGTWQVWVSYHNYYKAPDLIGPQVSRRLGIPYILIESTRARKRLHGPWARFACAAEAASDQADLIFYFTRRDGLALMQYAPKGQRVLHLPPFLDRETLPAQALCNGPMLAVGMLRPGDKLASYGLIAQTLELLIDENWRLDIVGSGTAWDDVAALMAPFGSRVRMLGAVEPEAMDGQYARASLLFWPGVNEAIGLSYLEAQAHGLPVVAQDRPGVRDVLNGAHPAPDKGPAAMAVCIDALLADAALRRTQGGAGREKVMHAHLRSVATAHLAQGIKEVLR